MPEVKLGLDAKIYRNTGSYASPSWSEVSNVRDVTLNLEKGEADVTTRAANGWRATKGTLKEMSIEFEMLWLTGDAGFEAVKDAFLNNTTIEFLALDGSISTSGNQGPRAEMDVISFSRNEPLEEGITVSVSLKTTQSDNPPSWYEVP